MQRHRSNRLRSEDHRAQRLASPAGDIVFWCFATGSLAVAVSLALFPEWDVEAAHGLLLLLGTATVCMRIARQLPLQNVLGAAGIIALLGGSAHAIGGLAGIPFGPFAYTQDTPRPIFGVLPWSTPLIWVLFMFSSRGVARLMLRPWRRGRNYGFHLIGLTCALTVFLDIGLEVFATSVFSWWKWSDTRWHFNLLGTPLVNFLGWAIVSTLILAFATPFLINKKPGARFPPDYKPLAVWFLINLQFAAAAFGRGIASTALVIMICSLMVTISSTICGIAGAKDGPEKTAS